jgi:hypothetical protein
MKYLVVFIIIMVCLISCSKDRAFGKLTSVSGSVQVFDNNVWSQVSANVQIQTGDSIQTLNTSRAVITFGKGTITLSEKTCIIIRDTVTTGKRLIAVLVARGELLSDVHGVEQSGILYEVWTPTAVAHAEGTQFVVIFSPQPYTTNVRVLDGNVHVFNPFIPPVAPVFVTPGYYTIVGHNIAPIAIRPMNYGQMKKMRPLINDDDYRVYEKRFRLPSVESNVDVDEPITVVVPVMPPPPNFQVIVSPFGMPIHRQHVNVALPTPRAILPPPVPFLLPPLPMPPHHSGIVVTSMPGPFPPPIMPQLQIEVRHDHDRDHGRHNDDDNDHHRKEHKHKDKY